MSIYASIFDLGWDHSHRCKRIRKLSRGVYEQDDSQPCTCGSCPIKYDHSAVMPSDKDGRGGSLGIAAIPGHICRPGRKALSDDFHPWHPWLRVSLSGSDQGHELDTVVLTRKQVKEFRDALTEWLAKAAGKGK